MSNLQLSPLAVKKFFRFALNRPIATLLLLAVVLISALLTTSYRAASGLFKVAAAPKSSATPKPQGCCASLQPETRRMIGTYYNVENGMTSTLTLNNKGPQPIAVTPILYSPDGKRFIAAPVTVPGESSQNVELGILARFAGQGFQSGSFEFTYEGRMMEIGGGLRIVDEAKSLIFDEQMLEPGMKFSSPQLEAVYAIPFDSAEVRVAISNKTDKPVAVKGEAAFAGVNGHHPINGFLKPRETSVVTLPAGLVKQARAGAVSLAHNGGAGALLAMIHVREAGKGYSASVNFTDPGQSKTSRYHGAGFWLGSVNGDKLVPIIAVRNLGDVATTVTGRVPFTTEEGTEDKVELRKTQLAAGEIKLIAVSGLPASNVATAGLELEYEGAPGSVIADALSVSSGGNQVFTLPLKDPQGGMSSTGGYPWFITDTSSTVVFIKNTTAETQQFHLDIVYPGGRWGSNLRTLAAGQTFKLDVRDIRDTQVKSPDGTAIPLDASTGHVSWSLRGKRNKTLIGRAQTVDFTKGLASTYECQCACGSSYLQSELLPYSISGFPGDTQQFTAREQDVNCFGGPSAWYDVPTYLVFFSADNGNVATINSTGLSTAIGEGQTNIRASWETAGIFHMDASGECWNEPVTADCSSSCEVQLPSITITSVDFNHLEIHNGESATITAQISADPAAAGKMMTVRFYESSRTGNIVSAPIADPEKVVTIVSGNNIVTTTITNSSANNNGTIKVNVSVTIAPSELRVNGNNPRESAMSLALKPPN